MDKFIDGKFANFNSIVKTLEIKKQKMILLGLLAETERQLPVLVKDAELDNYEVHSYAVEGHKELTENEQDIIRVMQLSSKYVPSLFDSKDVFMYFRSYEGKKIFTHKWVSDFPISEALFSHERCIITETCSIYARPFQLKDRVIVSPVYKDMLSNNYVISMASPVQDFFTKEIVGDFVVDFHIPSNWGYGLSYRTEKSNSYKNIIFEHSGFTFGRSISREHILSNRTKIVYRLSESLAVVEFFWLWLIFFVCGFFIYWKWDESRYRKTRLKEVLISANEDELTGLYNRRIFKEGNFIESVEGRSASIIAIDGNKIKRINDLHGHAVGDSAIKHIANAMRAVFEDEHYLVRSGGDEFLVIMPTCELEEAKQFAEKLKDVVTETALEPFNTHVSVSVGVAYKSELGSLQQAIIKADKALYRDKDLFPKFHIR
ncbi:GGDEF domain-containing protein [Vibrio ziniensis]|uniref:diguanylate cyclase n=1 Tax=Vibrio ziniensis TaxID=2711221 RepID=A0A6G7CG40_9VIBR|nr:GGDEF domain-containing protein [Vibrio ziniensis]QIH41054.1 GGDEF domain-containing protein [Vibrio ziniensis]